MSKPKKIKDAVTISIVMSQEQLERLKYMTRSMIKQTGRLISVSEAIRMAIETAYPIPKDQQMELFK